LANLFYRYSSNRVHYARIKVNGKEIKRSLETADPTLARGNLAALKDELRQIDRPQGRITLEELADRYLATIQRQKPKTVDLNRRDPRLALATFAPCTTVAPINRDFSGAVSFM
jgi:hypothetical protein